MTINPTAFPAPAPGPPQPRPARTQVNNKIRHNKRRHDTYIPDDTYFPSGSYNPTDTNIPDSVLRSISPVRIQSTPWDEVIGPTNPRTTDPAKQPSQKGRTTHLPDQGTSNSSNTPDPLSIYE